MENKINYHLLALEEIKHVDKINKPKLLLHACCGPCASYPLTFLCEYFKVTIYFNNSNIFPSEEYYRRLEELKKFLIYFENDYHYHVDLIITTYENDKYMEDLWPLKDEPECGKRCIKCYTKRMDEAYKFANENNYQYFTTVMSISRQKSSQVMNEIGKELSLKYPNTKYFFSDFKKDNGILKVKALKEKYGLYQQLYCGCEISYQKRLEWDKNKAIQNQKIDKK